MSSPDNFSSSYREARERLLECAERRGLATSSMDYPAEGRDGERLCVDAVWLGDRNASHVLLHLSGLHGVEGFLGSAIQLELLEHPPTVPDDTVVLFIHALNAYGMSWLRRVNEHNVDLNRNFLPVGEEYGGVHPLYRRLNPLLNPSQPPAAWDTFYLQALLAVCRFGYRDLKQAIASGQYELPKGLFYGGRELQPISNDLLHWLEAWLAAAERVTMIDIHSGLGSFGDEALLINNARGSNLFERYRQRLGENVSPLAPSDVAYEISGSLMTALPDRFPQLHWRGVGQEFGTYAAFEVLHRLRAENQAHHFGDPADLQQRSKQQMLQAFCPADEGWRVKVLSKGRALVERVLTTDPDS